jgi:hypothetical protein
MSEKKIVLVVCLIIIPTFILLAFIQQKYFLSESKLEQWSLYFTDPKTSDASFIIDNQGAAGKFIWSLIDNRGIIKHNELKIPAQEKSLIKIGDEVSDNEKVTITVKDQSGKIKSIYKSSN